MPLVLAAGVFDLLHVGHKRHLEEAAAHGQLVVGVTWDQGVNKPGRPIIPQEERLEMVKALRCVSRAFLCRDSIDALERTAPQVFVKGDDYVTKGLLTEEIVFCQKRGVRIIFTSPNPQTTTSIVERICESV